MAFSVIKVHVFGVVPYYGLDDLRMSSEDSYVENLALVCSGGTFKECGLVGAC